MRCKKQPADHSSSVGVCASCLRERLSAIIAAQAQILKQAQHDCWKPDSQSPPISFSRSASPYISRLKSETSIASWQPHVYRLFYSTPQVGPNGSITVEIKNNKKSIKRGKFSSLFLGFFGSKRNNKPDSDSGSISDPAVSIDSFSASPGWFSSIIHGRRKKKIMTFSVDKRTHQNRGRGMSPARHGDNEDQHCQSSGYSSDSQGWRQRPWRTPAHSKSLSGLGFCLSPLVRPSPNPHWSQKGLPPEMIMAGESLVKPKPHLSTSASFCKNRSRKLADFGRYTYDPTF